MTLITMKIFALTKNFGYLAIHCAAILETLTLFILCSKIRFILPRVHHYIELLFILQFLDEMYLTNNYGPKCHMPIMF